MKSITIALLLFCCLDLMAQSNCNCNEYIYLNDTAEESVHKWLVVGDTVQEILNATGGPWLENVIDPHGIGMDLNGFLYIGDRTTNPRKLLRVTCGGTIVDDDVTGDVTFSTLNIELIGNTLYSYDSGGIKAWNTCTGTLLEAYDPVTSACDITGETREDAWGFLQAIDGSFYGTRYIETTLNGDDVIIFNVYQFSSDYTNWGPDCSIPLTYTDTLLNTGLQRYWGLTQDPNTGNFVTVAAEQDGANRSAVIYLFDTSWNVLDTLGDYTDDNTGFAGTRGITYSPTLDKFLLATQRGDCISAVRIDSVTGELEMCEPLIPYISGSQGKGIAVVNECCPNNNLQVIDTAICVIDTSEPTFISNIYGCDSPICGDVWSVADADANVVFEPCDQSITFAGTEACATFTKTSDSGACGAYNISLNVCFYSQPAEPEISVTNNTCDPEISGTINIDIDCEEGSIIEYSIDGGSNWLATQPVYSTNSIRVRARCVNNANANCISLETDDITTAPINCCPPNNCIRQYGEFTIIKNRP